MRAITTPAEFVRSYACAVPPTRCGKPVATLRGRIFAAARPPSARSGGLREALASTPVPSRGLRNNVTQR